eukprot:gene7313-30116_t
MLHPSPSASCHVARDGGRGARALIGVRSCVLFVSVMSVFLCGGTVATRRGACATTCNVA